MSANFIRARCPFCGSHLQAEGMTEEQRFVVWVWCAYGPCWNEKTNNGAMGDTLDEAIRNFEELTEKETNL